MVEKQVQGSFLSYPALPDQSTFAQLGYSRCAVERRASLNKSQLGSPGSRLTPFIHWKIPQGNTDVLCSAPMPLIDTSSKALVTMRPSGKVQVPQLMLVKGSWLPLRDCKVLHLYSHRVANPMQFSYELLYVAIKIRLYLHPPNRGGYHFEPLGPTPRCMGIVVRHLLYRHNILDDIPLASYLCHYIALKYSLQEYLIVCHILEQIRILCLILHNILFFCWDNFERVFAFFLLNKEHDVFSRRQKVFVDALR